MSDLLTVPDDDDTRRGLIHAFAYAEGIRREDVPRVPAEARRRWENRADRALTELRFLSATYAAGQDARGGVAAVAALDDAEDDAEAPARRTDPRDLLAEALARPIDWATLLGTDDPEGAPR